MEYDSQFMKLAIDLAKEGTQTKGGGAFGAVITKDGKIIAQCYNQIGLQNDATQHAELRCIQLACKALMSKSLSGCELYASCEPCIMCLGASHFAGLDTIYFGATVADAEKYGYKQPPSPFHELPERRYQHFNMFQKMRMESIAVWEGK